MASSGGFKKIKIGNGPYYGSRPKANRQKNRRYYENAPLSSGTPLNGLESSRRPLIAKFPAWGVSAIA
jgi:hypothetical protein